MPAYDIVAPQYVTSGLMPLCHCNVIFMVPFSFSMQKSTFFFHISKHKSLEQRI